tara:strand:+ start:310 stop:618 length:309 start_codon:yes stop_codon:yes gene_type:complete
MALQNKGPSIDIFKDISDETRQTFLINEADRLDISLKDNDIDELLVQVNKKVGSYGLQHSELLTEAISETDITASTTRLMYKLFSLNIKPKNSKGDPHVDNS